MRWSLVLAKAHPDRRLRKVGGSGVILSLGGGVSPGMPKANIMALIEAVEEFNRG
ncbi:MAG: uroporphyrinogen decarboxylase family protein [Acidobacteriia bacterium]|nr:uroporphyrinogen decarboxylase family protein [Terriglobia bacterium]